SREPEGSRQRLASVCAISEVAHMVGGEVDRKTGSVRRICVQRFAKGQKLWIEILLIKIVERFKLNLDACLCLNGIYHARKEKARRKVRENWPGFLFQEAARGMY